MQRVNIKWSLKLHREIGRRASSLSSFWTCFWLAYRWNTLACRLTFSSFCNSSLACLYLWSGAALSYSEKGDGCLPCRFYGWNSVWCSQCKYRLSIWPLWLLCLYSHNNRSMACYSLWLFPSIQLIFGFLLWFGIACISSNEPKNSLLGYFDPWRTSRPSVLFVREDRWTMRSTHYNFSYYIVARRMSWSFRPWIDWRQFAWI